MSKISVVIPIYNVEKYIKNCVDSILNQTFSDFELILVDDGSPDSCGKICEEYARKDKRIVVIHKQNGGRSDARNKGIDWSFKNSDSEWITFIDGDDWVHKQYLEQMYDACIKNGVKMSSCGFEYKYDFIADEKVIENPKIDVDCPEELRKYSYDYSEYNITVPTCRLYHKSLWENIRFPINKIYEDEDVTYRLIYLCDRIAVVREKLYYYYQNPDSIMHSEFTQEKFIDLLNSFQNRIEYFYDNGFFVSFQGALCYYFIKVEGIKREYRKKFDKALSIYKKKIKEYLKKYKDYLPEEIKEKGYKKWAKEPYLKQYKTDLVNIREKKGFVFSVFWAIKNYWKI